MDAFEAFVTLTKRQVILGGVFLVVLAVLLFYLRDFLARLRMRWKRKRIMRQPVRNEAYGDKRFDIAKMDLYRRN
jgi:hypothetical protein